MALLTRSFAGARQPVRAVLPARRSVLCWAKVASVSDTRKTLAQRGWDRAWIDGVTERIYRKQVTCSVDDMNSVLDAIEAAGLKGATAEHACTIAWGALNRKPDQINAVVEYLRSRGVKDVAAMLFNNPKLMEYDVEGDELKKGRRARAKVVVTGDGDAQRTLVSFYSANASFNSAPIAPWSP